MAVNNTTDYISSELFLQTVNSNVKAGRFKVKNVSALQQKFLHLHYKEHLIPINGGRGNLCNEELKVTSGEEGWEEEDCFV